MASSQSGPAMRPRLRTSFAKGDSLVPFYSGGAVAVTSDGAHLATTFGSEVHMVETRTSRILHTLSGVRGCGSL